MHSVTDLFVSGSFCVGGVYACLEVSVRYKASAVRVTVEVQLINAGLALLSAFMGN